MAWRLLDGGIGSVSVMMMMMMSCGFLAALLLSLSLSLRSVDGGRMRSIGKSMLGAVCHQVGNSAVHPKQTPFTIFPRPFVDCNKMP